MIGLKSVHRAALPAIVMLALLTSASQAQQSYPTPEDAAAALAAAVKSGSKGEILLGTVTVGAVVIDRLTSRQRSLT